MKPAALLITFLPLMAFCQYDEELGYMPPAYPVDSSRPVKHAPELSVGFIFCNRALKSNPTTYSNSDFFYSHATSLTVNSFYATGFRIGYNYTANRLYFPFSIAFQLFKIDASATEYNWRLANGKEETTNSFIDYRATISRLSFSGGFGVRLLKPQSKFNVIPLISASPSCHFFNTFRNDRIDQVYDYQLYSPDKDSSSHIVNSQKLSPPWKSANIDVTAGVIISYRFSGKLSIQVQYMHGVLSTMVFEEDDKLIHFASTSLSYHLPVKTNYRPLKVKKVRETEPVEEETEK